jgi:hypothetical protein
MSSKSNIGLNASSRGIAAIIKKYPIPSGIASVLLIFAVVFLIKFLIKLIVGDGPSIKPSAALLDEPVIFFKDSQIILKPDASSTTSNYNMYEYATGDVSPANIDLTVNWTNGAGFKSNGVTSIILKRLIDGREISPSIIVTDPTAVKDFGGGSVIFRGANLKSSETGVGLNIIKVSYTTGINPEDVTINSDNTDLVASTGVEISKAMLDTTVNLDTITTLIIPVTKGSSLTTSITQNPVFTKYAIKHKAGRWMKSNLRMEVLANNQIIFKDNAGTGVSLWQGSPTSFFISDYMGYQMFHVDSIDSGNYWVYGGQGEALVSSPSTTIFTSENELNKALFKVDQLTASGSGLVDLAENVGAANTGGQVNCSLIFDQSSCLLPTCTWDSSGFIGSCSDNPFAPPPPPASAPPPPPASAPPPRVQQPCESGYQRTPSGSCEDKDGCEFPRTRDMFSGSCDL